MSGEQGQDPGAALIRWRDVHNSWATVREAKRRMLELLDLRDGLAVLDAGCGTGDDVLVLAGRVAPSGRAVGLDLDETLLAEARTRAARSALPARLDLGDLHALPYPDGTFDRCRCERVLHHLADPGRALGELVRVTRPGGRVVVGDSDAGELIIGGADPGVSEAIARCAGATRRAATRRLGRELGSRFRAAGLRELAVVPLLMGPVAGEFGPEATERACRLAEAAVAAGAVTARDAARWTADLVEADRAGTACILAPFFIVTGTKP